MDSETRQRHRVNLSKREQQILHLLAEGLTDRKIAERLVVAYTTVKWYNRQIFNKLEANNRTEAIEQARALGLLNAPTTNKSVIALRTQLTPLIGRTSDLDTLNALLNDPSVRLVTILAPGGMGKTRVALALVEGLSGAFVDGVCFIPLSGLTTPNGLAGAIATGLGVQFIPDRRTPQLQVIDFLRSKRLLLVLDSFEHLVDDLSLLLELMTSAPRLTVLITSRERLNVYGEHVYPLAGLTFPPNFEAANGFDYDAVQLFLASARRANTRIIAEHEQHIQRICRAVQGMPLAIELAAAWAGTLQIAEIADEIERNADFLRTSMQNVPERLRSIRAVFEAAWRRLIPDEQRVFARLSVFRGGFTREGAMGVAGANMTILAALVGKALVWHNAGTGRYDIHELLRQYAEAELRSSDEFARVADTHCAYFAAYVYQWAEKLKTPEQIVALELLDADLDNIRSAFRHAIEFSDSAKLDLFAALWYYYEIRGLWLEGEAIYDAAVNRLQGTESVTLAKLLAALVNCVGRLGQHERMRRATDQSTRLLREFRAERGNLLPFWYIGIAYAYAGDLLNAIRALDGALAMAEEFEDEWAISLILYVMSEVRYQMGDIREADILLRRDVSLLRKHGNIWGISYPLSLLGGIAALENGDLAEARRLYEECLSYARQSRHPLMLDAGLFGLTQLALAQGDSERARIYQEEILQRSMHDGRTLQMIQASGNLAEYALAQGDIEYARAYLRQALPFTSYLDLNLSLYFFAIAAQCTVHLGHTAAALRVLALVCTHDPKQMIRLINGVNPHEVAAALRQRLTNADGDAVWNEGEAFTLDEVQGLLQAYL